MREHEAQMMMNSLMMISAVILALPLGNVVRRTTVDVFVFVYPGICSDTAVPSFITSGLFLDLVGVLSFLTLARTTVILRLC